jgi:hypothetical protein
MIFPSLPCCSFLSYFTFCCCYSSCVSCFNHPISATV